MQKQQLTHYSAILTNNIDNNSTAHNGDRDTSSMHQRDSSAG